MVRIISDSTCDLSPALLKQYNIQIVPLHIMLGDQEYIDGQTITPDDIFTWSDTHQATPKTSAVSVAEAMQVMKGHLDDGEELLCFTISSKLSATYQNFCLAVKELQAEAHVRVIDSQNLSTGVGLLVLEAAEHAMAGKPLPEIEAHIHQLIPMVRASFVVETLTFLHRGGRCSSLAALAGGALKLHPRIVVADGAMSAGKKYRGRMHRVLVDYVHDMTGDLQQAKPKRVFITHSGCSNEIVESVRQELSALNHFEEILETNAGGVISSHCGPGTLGVLYITE